MSKPTRSLAWVVAAVCCAAVSPAAAQPWCEQYVGKLLTSGSGGDFAIDPTTGLLFLVSAPQELTVASTASDSVVATLSLGAQLRQVDVDTTTHRVYVTDDAGTLWVVDGAPGSATFLDVLAGVLLPDDPVEVAADPLGNRAFVWLTDDVGATSRLAVVNGTSLAVLNLASYAGRTNALSASADKIALDPVAKRLFLHHHFEDALDVVDVDPTSPSFLTIVGTTATGGAADLLRDFAIDVAAQRLYAAGYTNGSDANAALAVFDTTTLALVDSEVNLLPDTQLGQLAIDPGRQRLFDVRPFEGRDAGTLAVTRSIALPNAGAGNIEVDLATHRVYVGLHGVGASEGLGVYAHVDGDGDGHGNACDNCPGDPNPDQADTDGDGFGDLCDPDLDNDGCANEDDQDPDSSVQVVGGWISDTCNPRTGTKYGSTSGNSDGDRLLDCADPDDDNDGTPDEDDACPTSAFATCIDFVSCGLQPWWDVCLFSSTCREAFLKIVSVINPDPTIVFDEVEILNQALWVKPPAGTSLADAGAEIAGGAGGGALARGGFAAAGAGETLRMELWEKASRTGPERFLRLVAEYDPADVRLGDLGAGRWLVVEPPADGGTDPTIAVGASWIPGAPAGTRPPDADRDGLPNPFDSCFVTAQPAGIDTDGDGFGNRCDTDYDGDGVVGDGDQALLSGAASQCSAPGFDPDFDADGDCAVGVTETLLLAAQRGGPPGPSGLACPPGRRGLCADLLPACADGEDDDGDGLADFPADPGCADAAGRNESPQCDDGRDNDGDGAADWRGAGGLPPDPQCTSGARDSETPSSGCGLGGEAVLALALWRARRRR